MADLQPDTSIYRNIGQNAPFSNLNLMDLLSMTAQSRALGTQQAVSDSLKQNVGPNGQPDFSGALSGLLKNPNAYVTPQEAQSFTQAQAAQTELNRQYMGEASKAISSLITKTNASVGDFQQIAPLLARYGVPVDMLMGVQASASTNGRLDPTKLAVLKNWADGNADVSTRPVVSPTGETTQVPAGTFMYPNNGAPGAGGTVGTSTTALSPPTSERLGQSGKAANDLSGGGQNRANMRSMLLTLGDLSDKAATGPTAEVEKNINALWQRLVPGSKLTLNNEDLADTEKFDKIANIIAGQQATSSHPTDLFLHNAYGSNPNLQLSKLGRQGIVHWLTGNVQAEGTLANEWEKWLGGHPGQEGKFYDWMYGKAPGSTMDIPKFDPRVFQYEQMSPDERSRFRTQMTPSEQKSFFSHAQDYLKRGWVNFGGS